MSSVDVDNEPAADTAEAARAATRFTDPRAAGRRLAARLGECAGLEGAVVLGLARGGVPVALEVARGLGLPLDLVLIRRLFVPHGPLDPVCAVSVAGSLFLDEELTAGAEARDGARGGFVAAALEEFAARELACRGGRPALALKGRRVLLVDNGVRTGSTMRAALRALRAHSPARVVAAVPVAAPEARDAVEPLVDELVCLAWPRPFGHVGLWYANLQRPDDVEIRELLGPAPRPT
jgi:putative phosphoribosyl transferase